MDQFVLNKPVACSEIIYHFTTFPVGDSSPFALHLSLLYEVELNL